MSQTIQILSQYLKKNDYAVSIGGLGAIAEYESSNFEVESTDSKIKIKSRNEHGAFLGEISSKSGIYARESLTNEKRLWNREIIITEKIASPTLGNISKLKEIGKDENALEKKGAEQLLFDLGVGLENCNFCVRTDDKNLISMMRAYLGEKVATPNHPLLKSIIENSPTRVVTSKTARVEVYQKIAQTRTPAGPHTHLLPKLLNKEITQPNKNKIPPGELPVLNFHPKRVSRHDPIGAISCQNFDRLLKRFGEAAYVKAKTRAISSLRSRRLPKEFKSFKSRIENKALRIALIQSKHYFPSGKLAAEYLGEPAK